MKPKLVSILGDGKRWLVISTNLELSDTLLLSDLSILTTVVMNNRFHRSLQYDIMCWMHVYSQPSHCLSTQYQPLLFWVIDILTMSAYKIISCDDGIFTVDSQPSYCLTIQYHPLWCWMIKFASLQYYIIYGKCVQYTVSLPTGLQNWTSYGLQITSLGILLVSVGFWKETLQMEMRFARHVNPIHVTVTDVMLNLESYLLKVAWQL